MSHALLEEPTARTYGQMGRGRVRQAAEEDLLGTRVDVECPDPQSAYAQSKTADSLFAVEATHRWKADGIVTNAVNPGGVATGLQRDFTERQKDYLAEAEAAGVFVYKTAGQGAATTMVAAVGPEFAHTGGHYLSDSTKPPPCPTTPICLRMAMPSKSGRSTP